MARWPTAAERYRANVDDSGGPDACHSWLGRVNPVTGYGQFSVNSRVMGVHRWILGERIGRPLAAHEEALHSCDSPPCVNPRHLRVGTHAENMRDMADRGRARGWNSTKTHCPAGHQYGGANLRVREGGGGRTCRACARSAAERRRRGRGAAVKSPPFCPKGHEFTPENTREKRTGRACRQCERDYERRRRETRRAHVSG